MMSSHEKSTKRRRLSKHEAPVIAKASLVTRKDAAIEICTQLAAKQDEHRDDETKEHLEKTANFIRMKLTHLLKDDKAQKFQHNPDTLNRTFVSASQFSACQSQTESQGDEVQKPPSSLDFFGPDLLQEMPTSQDPPVKCPSTYKMKSITKPGLSSKTHQRRIKEYREIFKGWANELGCSTRQLAGLFLYLDSWPEDRETAKIGQAIF